MQNNSNEENLDYIEKALENHYNESMIGIKNQMENGKENPLRQDQIIPFTLLYVSKSLNETAKIQKEVAEIQKEAAKTAEKLNRYTKYLLGFTVVLVILTVMLILPDLLKLLGH